MKWDRARTVGLLSSSQGALVAPSVPALDSIDAVHHEPLAVQAGHSHRPLILRVNSTHTSASSDEHCQCCAGYGI
jgi:hypothetical protein